MNGLQEALAHERCNELLREANRYRQSRQLTAARRWRRRAEHALRQVEALEQSAMATRGDFELVGR